TVDCDAIKIVLSTDRGPILYGTSTNSAKLYYAYIFDASCNPASNTATRTTSILDLLSKINDPFNAIDGDLTSYSNFSFGIGVATTLYQTIYFPNLSGAKDAATLTVSIPPAVLSAGVLSYINVTAYNGTTAIQTITFGSLLMGTDLLTLLNSGQ